MPKPDSRRTGGSAESRPAADLVRRRPLIGLLRTLRPKQWVKNLFVGAPILFSKNLLVGPLLIRASLAVFLFCLLSGTVYILNDLVDVEKDRAHPHKRSRPIASRQLPESIAKQAAVLLGATAMGGALYLGNGFALAAIAYFTLNLAYSLRLKNVVFFDVVLIAIGFLLRVLAGALAIQVDPSTWLLVCTGLLACFLGFGKRAHELETSGERAETQRAVLARYRLDYLRWAIGVLAAATTVAYVAYTQSEHTVAFFGTRQMIWTTPFILVGVLRFIWIVRNRQDSESPTEEMLRNPLFLSNLGLWVAAVILVIYLVPP